MAFAIWLKALFMESLSVPLPTYLLAEFVSKTLHNGQPVRLYGQLGCVVVHVSKQGSALIDIVQCKLLQKHIIATQALRA